MLVAIDDLQWLDPPSAEALAFAARRLDGAHVRFLLARRPRRVGALERALGRGALARLDVGPLDLDATRGLLAGRLGVSVSRPLLRRMADTTLGNPLFALELGRTLALGGPPGDRRRADRPRGGGGRARHARRRAAPTSSAGSCSPRRSAATSRSAS